MGGQMGLTGRIGATLSELARRPEVEKVLEIGTYDGEGSTYCLACGLAHGTGRLRSVEVDGGLYRKARAFYSESGLPVDLEWGLTITPGDYRPFEYFLPAIGRTAYEADAPGTHRMWYERELGLALSAERTDVLRQALECDHWYDLVLFDGGEYSAELEFHLLEPNIRGYAVLDDTNPVRSIKNAANREWLIRSPDWDLVVDEPEDRCGWCVAKRR
ncbi:MAG TPA: hypothetical protein VGK50_08515 [Coriobacteriia bacterium]|jgi:hypothetical protein